MIDKTYERMMSEAYAFTREMELDMNDVCTSSNSVDINLINTYVKDTFFFDVERTLRTVCFNCIPVCIAIKEHLKVNLNINSIITSGNIYVNKHPIYNEQKENIRSKCGMRDVKCQFHTWLTIGDFIYDPTIMFTLGLALKLSDSKFLYKDSFQGNEYFRIIIQNISSITKFIYEPLFLGEEYLKKTSFLNSPIW